MKKNDFDFLLSLLSKTAGWDFSEKEYFAIDKKIFNFIRERDYASVEDLMAELRLGQKALVWQVIEALALSDTCFFRDYGVFKRFEEFVLPSLKEANRGSKQLRIWCLGCSTGQEAYSVAMIIKKLTGFSDWDVDIIGSDLSSYAISKAQRGIYSPFEVQMGLNANDIINNFTYERENWQINQDLRDMVQFRRYNLLDDMTFSEKFDVIFCRNVLRFFTPDIQKQLIGKIINVQTKGGFLYLGKNENISTLDEFYDKVSGFDCLYQAKSVRPDKVHLPENEADAAKSENAMPSFIKPSSLYEQRPILSKRLEP